MKSVEQQVIYYSIEALKSLMCETNMISCRKITFGCKADIMFDLLKGITYKNCDNIMVYVDFGRELDIDSIASRAAAIAIYINEILNIQGVDEAYYMRVIHKDVLNENGDIVYTFKLTVYCGSRKNYLKGMHKV